VWVCGQYLFTIQALITEIHRDINMSILPNEKKALNDLKIELNKRYELLDLRIFGSKAKGLDTPESDLDVMVVLKNLTPKIESEIDDLIFEINIENDCLITAIFFDQEELELGPLSESPIYKKISQEGIAF
jgi:predicted nucleotidyltransferase